MYHSIMMPTTQIRTYVRSGFPMKFTSGAMMIGNSPSSKEKATRRPIMKAKAVVPISLHFSIRLVRNFILNEK